MKKITLFCLFLLGTFSIQAQVQNYNVGDTVDDFTVTDTDGNVWNLYELTAAGKYVYIDFFFVDCPPCQSTARFFNEFYDRYGCNEGDLFMISINDTGDSDEDVRAFEDEYGGDFNYAPAVSTEGGGDVPGALFNIAAYPTYFLIGPDNTLLLGDIWPIDDADTFVNTIPAEANAEVMECSSLNIQDVLSSNQVNIYPNPNNGSTINIGISNVVSNADITVYNILGSVVLRETFNSNQITINPNLESGAYIVNIATDLGTVNKKLIVK